MKFPRVSARLGDTSAPTLKLVVPWALSEMHTPDREDSSGAYFIIILWAVEQARN
jgi:hypothetical protein